MSVRGVVRDASQGLLLTMLGVVILPMSVRGEGLQSNRLEPYGQRSEVIEAEYKIKK